MKILLLGANGFVGQNVFNVIKDANHEIISISKRTGIDLLNYEQLKLFLQENKPEIIINLAAKVGSLNYVTQTAADIFDENMRILLNVFKAIQVVIPKSILINPIANCAYPGNIENYSEEKFWDGKVHQSVLAYGNTRRMIDVMSECYKMQYGLRSINFYVPNMYGPFDSTDPNKAHALNALVSKIVKAKKEKKDEFEVWGSGVAIREWLFAKDYGRVLLETINNIKGYGYDEPFNVGQNFGLSVRELVEIIIEECAYEGNIVWNRNMPDGAPRKVMSDNHFKKIFPEFAFTELRGGIKETIKYYESVYPY
jgi:GDP-L-fucose synthase